MRIFAVSDLHIDYEENLRWISDLSGYDFKSDVLILAGDLSDNPGLIRTGFQILKKKFFEVLFVPGNHEFWIRRDKEKNSFEKLDLINTMADDYGIITKPFHSGGLSVVPLYGWYDYSFGKPSGSLLHCWADYKSCRWPDKKEDNEITRYFLQMNRSNLNIRNRHIISFSHFLPRIDIMPHYIPLDKREIYPVLGTSLLNDQLEALKPQIHIYGHSHINLKTFKDEIWYINNSFGYPYESNISSKELLCVFNI